MRTTPQRIQQLVDLFDKKIALIDGAMGTALQDLNLTAADFGGEELEGCNENLILTRPDVILSIHKKYFQAGCDIVETNTFGATPLVLGEYNLTDKAYEINVKAAQLARQAAAELSTPTQPRFVAGAIGPTTKAISVTGGVTFEELIEHFTVQARGLLDGGADYFLIETCQDTRNIKAALLAIDVVCKEAGITLPVAVSGTIEPMGTMLGGQSVEALYASLQHRDLLYLGLNCATGPEFMTDHIRSLSNLAKFRISCVPNAGLPDEHGCYLKSPDMISAVMERFIQQGWLNMIGGCCGTHPGHIETLHRMRQGKKPRQIPTQSRSILSGVDFLEVTDELRPVIVGERTNIIGSAKFKRLITEGKLDEAAEIAKAQVKNGAHIVDICLANPDRNELEDMRNFLEQAIHKVRVPLMIDSTDPKVFELALTYCQGKAILNSINLEDGEERFDLVLPTAKQFGAAVVVGTIDDDPVQGMGISRERKLEIAERSYKLLTEKWGIAPEDIYWDPLVFPCGTGDAQYVGSAIETIEGLRLIKQRFPKTKTILGISNVSFGLPPHGREVMNSVFLYHCVQAGLDLAIVNSEKLKRFSTISEEEVRLTEDVLFNRGADPVAAFAAYFREKKPETSESERKKMPLEDRLARYIIEGTKDGLADDLNEMMKNHKPLAIINGPLMKGMDEVGRLFNANQLIVAEVLQSAEAMKAAVAHLEPFMEKTAASLRGTVLLATVKGDVHDIGKNLVEIILSNNGFKVVNLGIKVPPEKLVQAAREHRPDIIGLSGLLVKSAQMMVLTAEDLKQAGIITPILVGGAALSSNFVDRQISKAYNGTVAYASDAMNGLELAKTIVDPQRFEKFREELAIRRSQLQKASITISTSAPVEQKSRSAAISVLDRVPSPPDFDQHVVRSTSIEQIWKFINPLMLYGRHLGLKGGAVRLLEKAATDPVARRQAQEEDPRALQVWEAVQELMIKYRSTDTFAPRAVYQYFRARSEGNSVHILNSDSSQDIALSFHFPRQPKADGLCLADYVHPAADNLALFVTSVGHGIRELSEEMKIKGDYLNSHIVQALALESAEAYAELMHSHIRKSWGFPDAPEMTLMQRFQAKYTGKRYSFGYPACPRLDDQAPLFKLLSPEKIGVQLTDGFMMDPEASVSAIVFHHPQASYFSVGTMTELAEENRV